MTSTRIPVLAAAAFVCVLSASACTSRPAAPGGSESNLETCVYCHGTVGRVGNLPGTDRLLPAAPPSAPNGKPAAVVGAHQVHLDPPINGPLRAPIACNECHVVPQNLQHATNPPANPVQFGVLARAQGASPTYEPLSLGCAAVYCHGNFDFNGVTGSNATPLWTDGQVTCVSCHGMPPAGHVGVTNPVASSCAQCHPSTVNANGSINLAGGAHLNGLADVVLDCTSCHGEPAGRTGILPGTDPQLASAPPAAPTGAPAHAVGAHMNHLNPPATGSFRGPVACSECHVVPTSSAHATTPPAQKVVFGTLATTGGATPTWVSTTTGCAATYCHGAFNFNGVSGANATPLWTATGLTCVSCHGMPPTGHPNLVGAVTAATCNQCHPATVLASGAIDVTGGRHINGASDLTGNPHTSDPLWVDRTHHGYSASSQGLQNCTNCHTNFGGPSGGTAGSCNACHTALGFANWQTNCTFCHGDPARSTTTLNPQLDVAPPVDSAGNEDTPTSRSRGVGAHSKHLRTPTVSSPFSCANCHATPSSAPPYLVVPTNIAHVDGQRASIPFGLIAKAGSATNPVFSPTTFGCSATYCHGNFAGGTSATPVWTSTAAMTCTSCHRMPTTSTGEHSKHMGEPGVTCATCHSGIATGTSMGAGSNAQITNPSLHVDGAKNLAFSGTFDGQTVSMTVSRSGSNVSCAGSCHGSKTW